MIDKRIAVVNE